MSTIESDVMAYSVAGAVQDLRDGEKSGWLVVENSPLEPGVDVYIDEWLLDHPAKTPQMPVVSRERSEVAECRYTTLALDDIAEDNVVAFDPRDFGDNEDWSWNDFAEFVGWVVGRVDDRMDTGVTDSVLG